jgi:hypothetical protein
LKIWLLISLTGIFQLIWNQVNRIYDANQLKESAGNHYKKMEFQAAAHSLEALLINPSKESDGLQLNLAICYIRLHRVKEAKHLLDILTASRNLAIRSQAYLQLGCMQASARPDLALQQFRMALKFDASNEEARFNYELLQKASPEKNPETNKREKEDGKNSQQMKTESRERYQPKESERSASKPPSQGQEMQLQNDGNKKSDALQSNRLVPGAITEKQAELLLQSLKNNELKNLQQLKRIPKSNEPYQGPDY